MDNGAELSLVIPLALGDMTFSIHAANKLAKSVVAKRRYAARAVGALRQQPLSVPFQLHHAARCIGDAVWQQFCVIRVVIGGDVIERIGFSQQANIKIVSRLSRAQIGIVRTDHTVSHAEPVISGSTSDRIDLLRHATIAVPVAAAHGTAGHNHIAQLACAVNQHGLAAVEVGEAGDMIVIVNEPVSFNAVITSRASDAIIKIVLKIQLLAAAVTEGHHSREAIDFLPAILT